MHVHEWFCDLRILTSSLTFSRLVSRPIRAKAQGQALANAVEQNPPGSNEINSVAWEMGNYESGAGAPRVYTNVRRVRR
jgi:hypothetical protein